MAYITNTKVDEVVQMVVDGGFTVGPLYSGVSDKKLYQYVDALMRDEGLGSRPSLVKLIAKQSRFRWLELMRQTKKEVEGEL